MAINLIELFDFHELKREIITFVKDDGFYLNTMITSLKSIVSYNVLGLKESFQGTCFDHAFPKVCQYATTYEKNYKGLRFYLSKLPRDFTTFDNLIEEDANVVPKLSCLVSNIRVLNCFLSFFKKYEKQSPIYAFFDVGP